MNRIAATPFAEPVIAFLTAFTRTRDCASIVESAASSSTPPAAPKYPVYTETANTAACRVQERSAPGTGARPRSAGWISSTSDAPAMSTGTAYANALAGVSSRIAAPVPPPQAVTRPRRITRARCPASSDRDPSTEPTPVSTSDTVLVTLADSGGRPSDSRIG
jgi:hypothetical protein